MRVLLNKSARSLLFKRFSMDLCGSKETLKFSSFQGIAKIKTEKRDIAKNISKKYFEINDSLAERTVTAIKWLKIQG